MEKNFLLSKMKQNKKIFFYILLFLSFLIIWFFQGKKDFIFANSVTSLTNFFSTWKVWMSTFYYPLSITSFTTEEGTKNHQVSITLYDGETFPKYEAVSNQSITFNKGIADILIPINTKKIKIDKDIQIEVVIDWIKMWHIKTHILWLYSDYSNDTDAIISDSGAVYNSESLIMKNDFDQLYLDLKKELDKKDDYILKKDLISNYTKLKNGKINIDAIPFWINNLTCNIQAEDLTYIEINFPHLTFDKSKITLNKVCKDGMTDFHQLIQDIRSYNKDQELLKNYK